MGPCSALEGACSGLVCSALVGACLVCSALVGACLVCSGLVGACLVCSALVGACLVCSALVGACLVCSTLVGACLVCSALVGACLRTAFNQARVTPLLKKTYIKHFSYLKLQTGLSPSIHSQNTRTSCLQPGLIVSFTKQQTRR